MAKNILSRETCKKDLKHLVKADLLSAAVLLVVVLLIFVPLILMGIYVSKYVLAFGLVCVTVCAIPPIVFVYKLIHRMMMVRLVERDGFSIVTDTVSRLSKGEPEARHTVNAIYFTRYGRYVPSKTTFDLSSVGDVFYLVVLHTPKKTPSLVFHSAVYECKEVDRSSHL